MSIVTLTDAAEAAAHQAAAEAAAQAAAETKRQADAGEIKG